MNVNSQETGKFRTFLQMTGESQNLRYDILVTGDYEYTGCPKKGVHKKLLEYNITFLSIEKTERKPCSIRERIIGIVMVSERDFDNVTCL